MKALTCKTLVVKAVRFDSISIHLIEGNMHISFALICAKSVECMPERALAEKQDSQTH
jgi:hypothetical protein